MSMIQWQVGPSCLGKQSTMSDNKLVNYRDIIMVSQWLYCKQQINVHTSVQSLVTEI